MAPACLLAESTVLLFSDDFPGTSVNDDKWTRSGFGSNFQTVANGTLTLGVHGQNHHANVVSKAARFNFHEGEVTVEVEIASFNEPDPWSAASFLYASMWFAVGPGTSAPGVRESPIPDKGFAFAINWRPGSLFIGSNGATVPQLPISEVPSVIRFEVNATHYTIVLQGATFTEGEFAGGNTASGNHLLGDLPQDVYRLMIGIESRGSGQPEIRSMIDSVHVYGPGIPEPTEWAGMPIIEDGWVDTGRWMGMLYVRSTPWIYSEYLQGWVYMPESFVLSDHSGAWMGAYRY